VRASEQWFWRYDEKSEQLSIVLEHDLVHHVPFRASRLVAMLAGDYPFDTDDADVFNSSYDYLEATGQFSATVLIESALNITAWHRFGRPQMPQSWHFQQNQREFPLQKQLCELNSGFKNGVFYVVERDEEFAVCMLLDTELLVSDIKLLKRFDTVKVLLNRMQIAACDPQDSDNQSHQHTA